ncbi:MAG: MBL fold metallo-hydrolase, partial [Clostridia bacterium]|nr:MBL fold metallo-hydrolase [Clostridia bacterium]
MKLKYLGTAAAEGVPALFCGCENCRRAREAGGKNIRSRSQAFVNDKLLIDYPCDTFYHFVNNGIDVLDIQSCIITHIHSDHYYPNDMQYPHPGFSYPPKDWKGFRVYGSEDITPPLEGITASSGGKLCAQVIKPYEPIEIDGLTVTPMKADHGTAHPYIYIISDGKSTMLYAHDTGIFPDETWAYLEKTKPQFDLISLDCTAAAEEELNYSAHMCLGRNRRVRDRMKEMGLLKPGCHQVLNHFSHNGPQSNYDDFCPVAA